ncbi:hypothetical protein HDU86_008215 [Geranomyces michiganensis]|nr:hypothetical protein HDU86_008215 [Geranomyces michiganensis]
MLSDTRRIEREIRQVRQDPSAHLTVEVIDDNLCHLLGTIQGPANSPYAGGTFQLDIVLPSTYPFLPPKMRFITPLYHPNVSSVTGAICLDILKDEWTPVLTLKTVMISLQSLLCDPVPDNPQDAEVASHYMRDRKGFDQTARQWTEAHAMTGATSPATPIQPAAVRPPAAQTAPSPASSAADPPAMRALTEMGFPRDLVSRALRQSDGNESRALEALLANNVI